jgi:hypothetical protein
MLVVLVAIVSFCGAVAGTEDGQAATMPRVSSADDVLRGVESLEPRPDVVFGAGWRTSKDFAWTVTGDPTGLHLLVAESRTGYRWRTAATLWEPGFDTDRWVGNACVTGSGRRAVVVYAPRQFTNRAELFEHGAFAAVVDLRSGAVTKLAVGVTLAYYNPGCGAAEDAVLTQRASDAGRTRLSWLDTAAGRITWRRELAGQASSAVPVGERVVAVTGGGLVAVNRRGGRTTITTSHGPAYGVHPDAWGGVLFMEQQGHSGVVRRAYRGRTIELGRGPLTGVQTWAGTRGRVFFTAAAAAAAQSSLPGGITAVTAEPNAELSTEGAVVVSYLADQPGRVDTATAAAMTPGTAHPVRLRLSARATGRTFDRVVTPGQDAGKSSGPRVGRTAAGVQAAASPDDPVDGDRTCAIARNDSRTQVYQPHWRQVEWAADLAVRHGLTFTRPANWRQSGLPAWSPQGLIPWVDLDGGGRVPAQIMLGILAQESNLWQASPHAVEGVPGNPLVGNFYGLDYSRGGLDYFRIDWSESDCGYGVAQVTDGMRISSTSRSGTEKRAIALDYATNIAAGLNILQHKWNQVHAAGITVNDGDPRWLENWFAAVWAYNTGLRSADAEGNWGLGYTNNPANADYLRNRSPFLEYTYDDARHPQWWPYPEKVLGWAGHPIVKTDLRTGDTSEGYLWAWWTSTENRGTAKPPGDLFCSASNYCDYTRTSEPCTRADFHCWWHWPVSWKVCPDQCGHENIRYDLGSPEPAGVENYPPNCSVDDLPGNALIVDDVPDSVPAARPGCGHPFTNAGTFTLSFNVDGEGHYRSKVDFHQIAGGFAGHFWFAHTRKYENDPQGLMRVTGTWRLGQELHGWARVMVHMPDHGAHTQQARYEVDLGDGTTKQRVVLQRTQRHEWVSLGAFLFAGTPSARLSSETLDGDGGEDIAWDAVAFQPLRGKPQQIVAMGDSFSSGEGASEDARFDYYQETDDNGDGITGTNPGDPGYPWKYGNACHRSRFAWSRQATLYDNTSRSIGERADRWDTALDYNFVACSGAETENLLPVDVQNTFGDSGKGKYRELSQMERGFLDENTDPSAATTRGSPRSSNSAGGTPTAMTTSTRGTALPSTRPNGSTSGGM